MIEGVFFFFVFVICVVLIVMILRWGMSKMGWTIDPGLQAIIGLFVFLVALLFFWTYVMHGHFGAYTRP